MPCAEDTTPFATVHQLARRLGLPASFLRDEARAGRLPCIERGGQVLFHVQAVERVLVERAAQAAPREVQPAGPEAMTTKLRLSLEDHAMTTAPIAPTLEGADIITYSRSRAMRRCPRFHEYSYELGIRPELPAPALRMGGSFHVAVEVREKGASVASAIAGVGVYYEPIIMAATDPQARYARLMEYETVARLSFGYFWRWSASPLETIAAEFETELPIINPDTNHPARLAHAAIKIDGIVRLADSRLAVRETKTIGESIAPDSDTWRRLRIDPQVSLAIIAARLAGHDVRTVLYDVVRKPEIRPKQISKADQQQILLTKRYFGEPFEPAIEETIPMWGARLARDLQERPDFYFARVEIARTDDELTEFSRDLWDQYQAMLGYRRRNHWPRNADACLTMGKCPYFDSICSMGRHLTATDELPVGFIRLDHVHPELSLSQGD